MSDLCDPMGCSPPGSSVHGILQVRILECVSHCLLQGSSAPRDPTCISYIAGGFFTPELPGTPKGSFKNTNLAHRKKFQVISDSRKRKQRRSPSWRSLQIFGGRFMEYTQKYNQGVSKQWIFKRMRAVKLPEGKTPWTWGAHGRRWNQFTLWKLSEDWKCIKDRYRSGRSPGEGNGNPL